VLELLRGEGHERDDAGREAVRRQEELVDEAPEQIFPAHLPKLDAERSRRRGLPRRGDLGFDAKLDQLTAQRLLLVAPALADLF
jgi:hypothetical protein